MSLWINPSDFKDSNSVLSLKSSGETDSDKSREIPEESISEWYTNNILGKFSVASINISFDDGR